MLDLTVLLDDAELRRRFGAVTLERAQTYLRQGLVLQVSHEVDGEGDLDVRGSVAGSGSVPYQTYVAVGQAERGLWVYGRCSCPVGESCKHALALLLAVRAEQETTAYAGGRRWERQLGHVLDELDRRSTEEQDAHRPLALQVELKLSTSAARHAWDGESGARRGSLRVRPLQRGARDNWVRSGVSWQDVPYLSTRRNAPPAQAAVLGEMLATYRAASRQTYFGSESHLPLGAFGASLWPLLRRAVEAGLVLVPGAGIRDIVLRHHPVELELDVNTSETDEAHLRLGVRTDEDWFGAEELDLLGEGAEGGHGVALWSPDASGARPAEWVLTLAPLARPAGPEVRRLLATGDTLVVPAEDREDLVTEYLPRLQRHVPVTSSDGSVRLPEPVVPRLGVTLTWVSVEEVQVLWTWRYRVAAGDREYTLGEPRGLRGFRRPQLEQQLLDALVLGDDAVYRLYGSRRPDRGPTPEAVFSGTAAIGFVEDALPALEAAAAAGLLELTEVGERPDYREAATAPVVRFTSSPTAGDGDDDSTRTDWLDLEVLISVDGETLPLAHLLEALTRGQDRVILRSGVHVAVDRPEFAHLAELVGAAGELHEQPTDGLRVSHHDLGLWDELAEIGLVDAQAAQWVRSAQALRGLSGLPEVEPVDLEADLRPYQLEGFRWLTFLWQSGLGGILADDMGLGKTLQTLALVAHARRQGAGPFLVVAPTSVVSTWAHEAATFTPGLVVREVTESQSRRGTSIAQVLDGADLVITSYTLYRLEADAYLAEQWGGLVLDEAQTVKNHQGKTHQAVRRLDVPFRLALTGTPMENRLMELWSLLSIVAPGLYPWPQRFQELVANPVERLGDTAALERFRRRIRPFLLRRTKENVAADLPEKQEQVLEVRLTREHRRIYDTHLQRERQTVLGLVEEDFDKHRIAIFRSLTRLRQLSLDPGLLDEEYDAVGSAKVDVLVDHLAELAAEGHRALVFSQFTSFLARVRARLDREGIASSYLDGTTRRRGEVVRGFKDGEAPVFLISLKAGGVGLTLTEADYVFVLDPWWNPAVEAQAVDRVHRIGQKRQVFVYRLVSENTIEQKVMELKARKAALFSRVIDGDGAMASAVGADDVRALFED
ncbi:DEAD/DEAH box helicase [Nocardioides mesophilus]|uniref:DEAD/DEAH box helicase n=1 Tax=Nocardioides mesophilus TaxID=433659 RepID=A0A7G9R9Z1_9ACTN|nr:DEAD/DEAH box helicase [Nocardioides mesophilus]QNN52416.1 DEAD/DEAH box helicase [Nocardioides mesophilus]